MVTLRDGTVIGESLSDSDYTLASMVAAVFKQGPRRYESITIHHWGSFGQTHDGIIRFFMKPNSPTSCHFVGSAGRVDCLVSPANASWAAGNAYGNATSIHIEARPEATDADYATIAALVRFLRETYGDLPLVPHNAWTATQCPGKWDLNRVDREARAGSPAVVAPAAPSKPAPAAPAAASSKRIHWVVEAGDTLGGIAAYYGIPKDVARIAAHNGIRDVNRLSVGQKIFIPGPLYWIIEAPDTIRSIAAYYGLDAGYLARLNGLPGPDAEIYIGNTLRIQA
jgi:N-acetylmuramoyl-L-alanine amidase